MIPYKKILLFLVAVVLLYAQAFSARLTYRAAMSAFNEKDYYTARLLLQEIVHKDPLGEFGDDSAYHIGLTYFYEGKYPAAIFELNLLGRDYPRFSFCSQCGVLYCRIALLQRQASAGIADASQFCARISRAFACSPCFTFERVHLS